MLTALLPILLAIPASNQSDPLLRALKTEVEREYQVLKENSPPVYYLAYRAEEEDGVSIEATLGEVTGENVARSRRADAIIRVGSPELDNTHELKARERFGGWGYYSPTESLPLEDDEALVRRKLWLLTQKQLGTAVERYQTVTADDTVKAQAEDRSPDFSLIQPSQDLRARIELRVNKEKWTSILRAVSRVFRAYPTIYISSASFQAETTTKFFVDSTGTILRHPVTQLRVYITGATRSEDGMPLFLHQTFQGLTEAELPSQQDLEQAARGLAEKLVQLRRAPAVEPYVGPALFMPKAAAVFFHEVMGHRLEGHRQKSEQEGQTFTKKVGQPVLPPFMSLVDDPTMDHFQGKPLLGHYLYDDEGARAQRVSLVDKGVLKGFLMGRSPITGFADTNGHGRGTLGRRPVARQGNLMALTSETIPSPKAREMLIDLCRQKGKPYGLIFSDISGGFTMTGRFLQAFKVIPLEVYRVYTDGRLDELVRGADIVGTPLAALEKIVAAYDDYDVFNGVCGAESGGVPVSAVSPSILVGEVEVEKKEKDMVKPPILPSPLAGGER
ncbi:MAG: metallopeptidase TldD-related protein [Acidobacteriota bacterium]